MLNKVTLLNFFHESNSLTKAFFVYVWLCRPVIFIAAIFSEDAPIHSQLFILDEEVTFYLNNLREDAFCVFWE